MKKVNNMAVENNVNNVNNYVNDEAKKAKRIVNDFNEVTRIARKYFLDSLNAIKKAEAFGLKVENVDIAQLKYKSIKKAVEDYGKAKFHLNTYIIDFHRRVYLLEKNYFFREWCKLVGVIGEDEDEADAMVKVVAQHIVFEGQTMLEDVLFKQLLVKEKLEIPFHAEWINPIFKDKLEGQLKKAENAENNQRIQTKVAQPKPQVEAEPAEAAA